jgi:hypothetical protein
MIPFRSDAQGWGSRSIFHTAGRKIWDYPVSRPLTAGIFISRSWNISSRNFHSSPKMVSLAELIEKAQKLAPKKK